MKSKSVLLIVLLSVAPLGCQHASPEDPAVSEKTSASERSLVKSEHELLSRGSSPSEGDPGDSSQFTPENGMPFGRITEDDLDRLCAFAKEHGLDLGREIDEVYEKSSKDALGRVFQFSMTFNRLDKNARAYGQLIYSSFLNLGEAWGVEAYSNVLVKQEPQIRQRIRDCIFYPTGTPSEEEKLAAVEADNNYRKLYPKIFPQNYAFGKDDPVFGGKRGAKST
jgi:hypothetical protein